MNTNTILNSIYAIGVTICILGIQQDIKERKFANKKILIMIVLGLISAYFVGRVKEAILLFLAMNILGVFMSNLGIFGASDWKLFSTMCLFIPFERVEITVVYITSLLIATICLKIFYTNKGYMKEALLDEWRALKVFLLTRQKLSYNSDSQVYKSETVPVTVSLGIAFIVSILCVI